MRAGEINSLLGKSLEGKRALLPNLIPMKIQPMVRQALNTHKEADP